MVKRSKPMFDPTIANEAPTAQELTDYDYRSFIVYVRLLDAESDGADWREVARVVLKIDPDKEYVRAKRAYDTHMARAHWMTEQGYRPLLEKADGES
jgi:hypothetical protein